jgi:opacity protein-like surface antigen
MKKIMMAAAALTLAAGSAFAAPAANQASPNTNANSAPSVTAMNNTYGTTAGTTAQQQSSTTKSPSYDHGWDVFQGSQGGDDNGN